MTEYEHDNERENGHGAPGAPRAPGGWQPIPQGGEYDADATAFVQLPEGMTGIGEPLAAPGHDYVPPPHITPQGAPHDTARGPDTDPGATGTWSLPPMSGELRWPEPGAAPAPAPLPPHESGVTGQWSFGDSGSGAGAGSAGDVGPPAVSASELTGQWTIPVANGDLPDESGEFTTSALASQWSGGHPPVTLPGGASAPWANTDDAGLTLPGGAPAPWAAALAQEHAPAQETAQDSESARDSESSAIPMPPLSVQEPPQHPDGAAEQPSDAVRHTAPDADIAPGTEAVAEAAPEPAAPPAEPVPSEHPHASYVLRVNGADRPVTEAWIGESLLYVLRERLGLAGAKDGCSQGECGACAVQVDGRLVASCLVPAATTAGSEVRTVEGLAIDGEPSDVQRALATCGAVQCGFCVPGMAMTVHDLLEGNHAPSELETRQALCGNLCRCSGYRGVLEAVREVVAERSATAASDEARIPHQAPPGAGSVQQPHPHDGGMA
ncbi:(2Fe-2S)-binding protein [Streptomyces sp. 21So2-11]|uniref:(2Fe-2S)-binding protein n=1 Tax=Streptomyces sp. 21So2-11 TaxID=3144408 RepID=UPI00321A69E4